MNNEKEIVDLFQCKKSGSKGWFGDGECPYCKHKKLGIIFRSNGSFHCWYCEESGTVYKLLREVGRLELFSGHQKKDVVTTERLKNKLFQSSSNDLYCEMLKKTKPLGFSRIYNDDYLESRGFTKEQFEKYIVGETNLDPLLRKNYIIFLLIEDDECKGWIARSRKDAQWISQYNEQNKFKHFKYLNSPQTNFGMTLFGIDEVEKDVTKKVILVEGVFDKFNIERLSKEKCLACFGKKITDYQIKRLLDKGVQEILLLFDSDAVKESKECGLRLSLYFDKVRIGFIESGDCGDMVRAVFHNVIYHCKEPLDYVLNKVQRRKLA